MAILFKISEFRSEYNGLNWARDWNQGGTRSENLRCNLASQLQPRIAKVQDMLNNVSSRYARDIESAKEALEYANAAILRNSIGRAVLFQILGSETIPAGQYLESDRVDVVAIRAFVQSLTPDQIFEWKMGFHVWDLGKFILPDPNAAPSNCVKFPGT